MPAMGSSSTRKTNAMESDFSSEFEDQRSSASHEQLQRLLDQIDEQGAKLTKTPTYDELIEYRSLIKNFVGTVVSQMYDVSTQSGWDRMGRQKVYTTVRKIDTELENMAEKIRLGQSEQLDVVASHDAIRGMLIDLYM
ncbi:YaaR family protein [Anaerovibrio lipolyticus]|uniref:YaaR family protein n=1 Tax=Anaerovibrio lipolyticus TaxID=82374 RepID=UPI0026EF7BA3|nr:YaaR family protein [Anaerovibrio lipolyticus]